MDEEEEKKRIVEVVSLEKEILQILDDKDFKVILPAILNALLTLLEADGMDDKLKGAAISNIGMVIARVSQPTGLDVPHEDTEKEEPKDTTFYH